MDRLIDLQCHPTTIFFPPFCKVLHSVIAKPTLEVGQAMSRGLNKKTHSRTRPSISLPWTKDQMETRETIPDSTPADQRFLAALPPFPVQLNQAPLFILFYFFQGLVFWPASVLGMMPCTY